jgi:hypothetical protein
VRTDRHFLLDKCLDGRTCTGRVSYLDTILASFYEYLDFFNTLLFVAFGGLLPRSKGRRPPPTLLSRCVPLPYGAGIACGKEAPVSLFLGLIKEALD